MRLQESSDCSRGRRGGVRRGECDGRYETGDVGTQFADTDAKVEDSADRLGMNVSYLFTIKA